MYITDCIFQMIRFIFIIQTKEQCQHEDEVINYQSKENVGPINDPRNLSIDLVNSLPSDSPCQT